VGRELNFSKVELFGTH